MTALKEIQRFERVTSFGYSSANYITLACLFKGFVWSKTTTRITLPRRRVSVSLLPSGGRSTGLELLEAMKSEIEEASLVKSRG